MNNFSLDENGIWTASLKEEIMYPDTGNKHAQFLEDTGSFWFDHRNDIISEVIEKFPYRNNFADIGGGNGFQLMCLSKKNPSKQFYLIEPGYNGCLVAHQRGIKQVYNCAFQEFDFNKADTGGLGLFDVLEHIPDDEKFLNDLYTCIPPSSRLYITVPAYQFLWNDVDDHGKHQRRYNKKMMFDLVAKTRFRPEYFSYFFSYIVLPTYLLRTLPYRIFGSRTLEELRTAEEKQHNPSKLLDKIFAGFNNYEVSKIKLGSSMSFGASCLIVLAKNEK